MSIPVIDEATCTGCGDCVDSCPTDAISIVSDKAKLDPELCAECGACVDDCPTGAITMD